LSAQKPAVEREHMAVLDERYDLSNRPAAGVTMDRTKPVQEGVRVKLAAGATWDSLAGMTPEQIRDQNLFPPGFLPLPHPKHQRFTACGSWPAVAGTLMVQQVYPQLRKSPNAAGTPAQWHLQTSLVEPIIEGTALLVVRLNRATP
jgi:hypothetical protein